MDAGSSTFHDRSREPVAQINTPQLADIIGIIEKLCNRLYNYFYLSPSFFSPFSALTSPSEFAKTHIFPQAPSQNFVHDSQIANATLSLSDFQ